MTNKSSLFPYTNDIEKNCIVQDYMYALENSIYLSIISSVIFLYKATKKSTTILKYAFDCVFTMYNVHCRQGWYQHLGSPT